MTWAGESRRLNPWNPSQPARQKKSFPVKRCQLHTTYWPPAWLRRVQREPAQNKAKHLFDWQRSCPPLILDSPTRRPIAVSQSVSLNEPVQRWLGMVLEPPGWSATRMKALAAPNVKEVPSGILRCTSSSRAFSESLQRARFKLSRGTKVSRRRLGAVQNFPKNHPRDYTVR